MPRILDNLSPDATLLSTLRTTLQLSQRADFCVGYFNLRGWKHVDQYVDPWSDHGQQARILIGMHHQSHEARAGLAIEFLIPLLQPRGQDRISRPQARDSGESNPHRR